VHFHSGTAEIEAEVRLLDGAGGPPAPTLQPGASAWVRIILRNPALLLPGDRFIIRMFSPVTTIGGGVVVDLSGADHRSSRSASSVRVSARPWRGPAAASRLEILASPDPAARIALLVREAPFGMGMPELVARTGMLEPEITAAAAHAPVVALAQPRRWYVDGAWFQSARERLTAAVGAYHRANPLAPGIAKEDLRGRALPGSPAFLLDALLVEQASRPDFLPIVEGNLVRLQDHRVALQEDERRACDAIERAFEQAGLATPPLSEALAKSGVEPPRARALLAVLLRDKTLIRIGDDLVFHRAAIQKLRALLAGRKPARFRVGDFKEWTGVSRKYAIPLLEYLDRERITRREGDARVIL
jgi:selenocysteine-specific elongation factor